MFMSASDATLTVKYLYSAYLLIIAKFSVYCTNIAQYTLNMNYS